MIIWLAILSALLIGTLSSHPAGFPAGSGGISAGQAGSFNTVSSGTITGLNNGIANAIIILILDIPVQVTFSKLGIVFPTGTGVNHCDYGIYTLAGVLVCNVGPQTGIGNGALSNPPILQGPNLVLPPGRYLFGFTMDVAGSTVQVFETTVVSHTFTTATVSALGTLPANIVVVDGGISASVGDATHSIPVLCLN